MIAETPDVVERFMRYAVEEARRVVRGQEIGGMANFEDIAAESCAWAIENRVLAEWEQRGSVEDDERQLQALACRSVRYRTLEAKRAARNPRRRFQSFFVLTDREDYGFFDVVHLKEQPAPGASHASLRREGPEVAALARAEETPLLWKRWREILAELPEPVRECVDLVLRERKSYVDAAETLGLRVSTVRMRVERHRERIARQLGDEFLELL